MSVIVADVFCGILVVAGITIALKGAGASAGSTPGAEAPAPATYATRIAGVMMMAFGIALGTIVTTFSIASG